jgi:uncharacterized protein with NRDE domain
MCTIIVRHQLDDWCSTIVASNRDEFYDRPATGPVVLCEDPRVVGGLDERERGTWFGVTRDGLFLGLTNQRSFGGRDGALRSRGLLALEALQTGSFRAVKSYLERVDPAAYNEFNLIFGDGREVGVAYGRRDTAAVEIATLGKGVHVLCNDRLGSPEFPKAEKARARVLAIPPGPWPEMKNRLIELLSDASLPEPSEVPPLPAGAPFDRETARHLQAICVKTPVYGTVSASVVAVRPGRVEQYLFSQRPPCDGEFEDALHLTHGDG